MSAQTSYERRCWKCADGILSDVVEDGVVRAFCSNCGIAKKRGRPRTQRGMRASRAADRMSYPERRRIV